jgi:hypothetical protein
LKNAGNNSASRLALGENGKAADPEFSEQTLQWISPNISPGKIAFRVFALA